MIDQSQVGANKRGCIATYVGAFDHIRKYFSNENNLHQKSLKCGGSRYKEKVLRYKYKGKNIVEVLAMTASEVEDFFDDREIKDQMRLLDEVGLNYKEMGQTLDTLSGGESQRLKLASRLQKSGEFYILDEPTSGLHFADVEKLIKLLSRLVDNGNTILVVEHNLDVIKNADWVIDLGKEGGEKGGEVIVEGTPSQIAKVADSYTGKYLSASLHEAPSPNQLVL